jgi:pyruvate dehydrogenase E2 component (dihydrolipoamide acetyltransferase)
VSVLVSEGDKIDEGDSIVELEMAASDDIKIDQKDSIEAVVDAVQATEEVQQELLTEEDSVADNTEKVLLSVTIPDIGGATDVDVIEVAVAVGFEVIEGDS